MCILERLISGLIGAACAFPCILIPVYTKLKHMPLSISILKTGIFSVVYFAVKVYYYDNFACYYTGLKTNFVYFLGIKSSA